ncbi:MAG: AarF/UbiB family protein [Chloroflexota bacterium]|nr:AarF/UbiB family protein [Chloroflexota bacterium]
MLERLPPSADLRRRFWTSTFYLARTLAEIWWWEFFVPHRLNLGILVRDRSERRQRWAREFRAFALQMGGVWIKLGQFFSSRADLLPPDVTAILSDLQDEVQPVGWSAIEAQIIREMGGPLEAFYATFARTPRAAASLGQVHDATLPSGELVAVKVQRPGIRAIVEVDLEALRWAMNSLKGFAFIRRRANLDALFEEFAATLRQELDYIAEGRHAEQLAENFADDPHVDLPRVYWKLTTLRVLTLERIDAIKINNYAALERAGISRPEVAQKVFQAYLKQIFEDGFFHADPHPGNLFIRPLDEPRPAGRGVPFDLIFLDFGAVGHISDRSRSLMRRMVIATVRRDYPELVRTAKELGLLLPEADNRALILALETLFDRYYGLTMAELSAVDFDEIEQLSRQFRDLLYEFPFQIPQDFVWLGRTLSILGGIATGLDPNFNPVDQLQPFARRLVGAEAGTRVVESAREASELAFILFTLPRRLEHLLRRVEDGELIDEANLPLVEGMAGIEGAVNRLTDTMMMMMFSVGWYVMRDEEGPLSYASPVMLLASLWAIVRLIRGRR